MAPQGTLRLPAAADTSKIFLDSTLDWPPAIVSVRAFTLPEANWSGVSAIEINLRQKERIETIVLSPGQREQSVNLGQGPIEFNVRVKATREPEALGAVPVVDATFHPLTTSNLFLDPVVLSGRRVLKIVAGAIDFAVVSQVSGTLTVADGTPCSFQLNASHPETTVPVWGGDPVRMQAQFVLPGGERISIERIISAMEPVVVINQPSGRFHVVSVMLQDPLDRYSSVSVTLEAADGAPRRNFVLDSANPAVQWSAPRDSRSPTSFRYRVKKVLRNASVEDFDWCETTGSLVVVGDLDIRIDSIQGFLLLSGDMLGALIHLEPVGAPPDIDAAQDVVLDAGQTSFTANLAFAKTAPRQYTVSGPNLPRDRKYRSARLARLLGSTADHDEAYGFSAGALTRPGPQSFASGAPGSKIVAEPSGKRPAARIRFRASSCVRFGSSASMQAIKPVIAGDAIDVPCNIQERLFTILARLLATTWAWFAGSIPAAAAIAIVTGTSFARADWVAVPGAVMSMAGNVVSNCMPRKDTMRLEQVRIGP